MRGAHPVPRVFPARRPPTRLAHSTRYVPVLVALVPSRARADLVPATPPRVDYRLPTRMLPRSISRSSYRPSSGIRPPRFAPTPLRLSLIAFESVSWASYGLMPLANPRRAILHLRTWNERITSIPSSRVSPGYPE